jgi:integrase
MEVLTAILNFSTKTRRIPFYPASGFTKLKEHRSDIEFWEQDQAEAFLNFSNLKYAKGTPERWIHVVYLLALNTALRAGEIWGLQAQDIKQNAQVLHIQRQWDRVDLGFRLPKGKSSRFVPCNKEIGRELEGLIAANTSKTVFSNFNGNPICHENFVKRVFNKDLSEAAVKQINFHGLRHTATTLMIANGVDIKTVQEICGHQNITTTMKYTHLLAGSVKSVAQLFTITGRANHQR